MRYYPIYLDLQGRRALVVGGGAIAEGKIQQLLAAGACVRVVSPQLTEALRELSVSGGIEYRCREFHANDLDDIHLVISATDQQPVNEAVAEAARARGLLCNVVDQPRLCNFITPALVTRGNLQISVSTGGGSPSLTQRVKREIAELIGEEYGELLELVAEIRAEIRQRVPTYEQRRDLLKRFVESEALELLRAGRRDQARELADRWLAQHSKQTS